MIRFLLSAVLLFSSVPAAIAEPFGLLEASRYTKQPDDKVLVETGFIYASEDGFVAGQGTLYALSVAYANGLTPESLDTISGKAIISKPGIDFYRSQEQAFGVDYLSNFDFSQESYPVMNAQVYIVTVAGGGNDTAPTVTVTVTKRTIREGGGKNAAFVITLDKPAKHKLPIPYVLTGTATVVDDYKLPSITSTAMIAKGKKSARVVIKPTDNSLKEPREKVVLKLQNSTGYKLTKKKSATIQIKDDD